MILSLLIPTMFKRAGFLDILIREIGRQIYTLGVSDIVEVVIDCDAGSDKGGRSTGQKRNDLVKKAKGKYIVHVDDDDRLPPYYIEELLTAAESDADCFSISGVITTNGSNEKVWHISKDMGYGAKFDAQGREYYERFPNHICPMKREIALQVPFPHTTVGEDYAFATALRDAGLIKTEYRIDRFPMYFYDFKNQKV